MQKGKRFYTKYLLPLFFANIFSLTSLQADNFAGEGSDLIMGVGAKHISQASAVNANVNDVYAVFYNPAGLTEITSTELSISTQTDAQMQHINFLGLAFAVPVESLGLKFAFALAYIPRLYMKADGKYTNDQFESIFLRYTLINIAGDFDAKVVSKTDDIRIGMAIAPLYDPTWSLGIVAARVNCASTFAGVETQDTSNFIYSSTIAEAFSFTVGAKYFIDDDLKVGISLKNLASTLKVHIDEYDNNGLNQLNLDVSFPYDASAGVSYQLSDSSEISCDYQQVVGSYGTYDLDFRSLRIGSKIDDGSLSYTLGAVVPLKLKSSYAKDVNLKFPFMPTAGIGWSSEHLEISSAFYFHPVMSLHKNAPSPSLDLSLTYRF